MATFVKVADAIEPLLEAINSGSDTWKIALAATSPASSAFVAGTTDLTTSGGYTAGGNTATVSSATQSAGTYKLVLNSPSTWTATGGGFTFRYVLLVNSTNNITVGYWDYGGNVVMNGTNGDTFTANLDGTNGVFQVT
jgi:hypothetical protein